MRYRNFKAYALSISGLGIFFLVLHYTDKDLRSELEQRVNTDINQRKQLSSNGENDDFGEKEFHEKIGMENNFMNMDNLLDNAKSRNFV